MPPPSEKRMLVRTLMVDERDHQQQPLKRYRERLQRGDELKNALFEKELRIQKLEVQVTEMEARNRELECAMNTLLAKQSEICSDELKRFCAEELGTRLLERLMHK